jgi:hypothetical protein
LNFFLILFNFSLAGVSRSVTIAIAYIMTATDLSYQDSLNTVRGARKIANPNFGFQRQLQNYEFTQVKTVWFFLNSFLLFNNLRNTVKVLLFCLLLLLLFYLRPDIGLKKTLALPNTTTKKYARSISKASGNNSIGLF